MPRQAIDQVPGQAPGQILVQVPGQAPGQVAIQVTGQLLGHVEQGWSSFYSLSTAPAYDIKVLRLLVKNN